MLLINIIRGLSYATAGRYSDSYKVADALVEVAGDGDLSKARAALCERRDALREQATKRPIDQAVARAWALERDVTRIIATADQLDDADTSTQHVCDGFETLTDHLRKAGFQLGDTQLHIADDFPGPYRGAMAWAMNVDVSDERAYGVSPGVYVRRDLVMPLYTPFLIAHELVHAVCGQKDSDYLARGIEDGLGDVFGSLYLGRSILDSELCARMLLNSRLIFPQSQHWAIYSDGLHQALLLHELLGINGLTQRLNAANRDGRGVIKEVERTLLAGEFDKLNEPEAEQDPYVSVFAKRFRTAGRNLVVSPLSFFLAHHLSLGTSTSQLLSELEVDPGQGESALRELQDRVFLVFVDKGEVWADETKTLLDTGALRYEL